jgi:hypothetical protein
VRQVDFAGAKIGHLWAGMISLLRSLSPCQRQKSLRVNPSTGFNWIVSVHGAALEACSIAYLPTGRQPSA